MKINYFIIPLITVLTSLAGNYVTKEGMVWYKTLSLPGFTPPGYVIGMVWTIIFILATISALIVYNQLNRTEYFWLILACFIANAILNATWSYLFFGVNEIFAAVIEAIFLGLSVIALIVLIWPHSRLAAGLLIPYAAWVAFATYLTYLIWQLNK